MNKENPKLFTIDTLIEYQTQLKLGILSDDYKISLCRGALKFRSRGVRRCKICDEKIYRNEEFYDAIIYSSVHINVCMACSWLSWNSIQAINKKRIIEKEKSIKCQKKSFPVKKGSRLRKKKK